MKIKKCGCGGKPTILQDKPRQTRKNPIKFRLVCFNDGCSEPNNIASMDYVVGKDNAIKDWNLCHRDEGFCT